MIPITLVTGFLGSGKTTFLQRIIERYPDRRLVYLVNDFSSVDVDGRILTCDEGDLISVAGGSIFCRCLVTEFVGRLTAIAERAAGAGVLIEGVVIEASGIADPRVVARMLQETKLDREFRLGYVVSVVDPGSFLKLLHTLPNIRAQVAASGLALVNKADLYSAEQLREVENALHEINPNLATVRTEHCRTDIDLFDAPSAGELVGEYALCADPNYASATIALDRDVNLDRFIEDVQTLSDDLYRAKGFVRVSGELVYVDVSPSGVNTHPAGPRAGDSEMVFIVRGAARDKLDALAERLTTPTSS